ncbi:MAG TPA: UDP-4-amino-4,6-dideoxy-N-acetyl-beta-L-altrosamine N-acetyltransferase [Stellaceae bacterium]|nr:UDP-4-amino-4,6-dideoxy-N-acetyl-beta-L-altrosamine N-acetyltransferase [Stellaceae bacterium]
MDAERLPHARSADGSLALRPLASDDRERLLDWRNRPHVARHMYTEHEISTEEHAAWFERALTDPARRYWIILADGVEIGLVNLYDIDPAHGRCALAIYIAELDRRGKGIGTFVDYAVLSYVFDRLDFNRICCEVLAENDPGWRIHLKCGFTLEGRLRRHIRKGNAYHDVVLLAMLQQEWPSARRMLERKLGDRGLSLNP